MFNGGRSAIPEVLNPFLRQIGGEAILFGRVPTPRIGVLQAILVPDHFETGFVINC